MPRLLARVAPADWHWWIGCTHLAMQWRGMLLKPWKSMPSIEVRGTPLQEPWSKPLECAADSAFKGCIQSLCLKNMFQQFSWACKIWPFLGDGFVTLSYKVSLPDLVQRAPSIESPGQLVQLFRQLSNTKVVIHIELMYCRSIHPLTNA